MDLDKGAWVTKDWWVSHLNYRDDIRKSFSLPSKVEIHDATLRDGEQTPGVVLRKDEKIKIAYMLDEIGIERIEAGMPVVSAEDKEAVKEIAHLGLNAKVMSFNRAVKTDIDTSLVCDVDGVIVEWPIAYPRLKYTFKWTEDEAIQKGIDAVSYAKDHGLFTVAFPYDTTRADLAFTERTIKALNEVKVDAVTIVDTLGCALPEAFAYLIRQAREWTNVPIEAHVHNDLGLATANSLAAIAAGAQVVQGTVNGIGERGGNTAIEEIMVDLRVLYGMDVKYKFERLYEISKLVQDLTKFNVAKNKAIVGENEFTRESGIGIASLIEFPLGMLPLNPPFVGQKVGIMIGKKSGRDSIKIKLRELGLTATDEQVEIILDKVKVESIRKKAVLDDQEFTAIVKEVTSI
jgi:methanogen homocitrate synthase